MVTLNQQVAWTKWENKKKIFPRQTSGIVILVTFFVQVLYDLLPSLVYLPISAFFFYFFLLPNESKYIQTHLCLGMIIYLDKTMQIIMLELSPLGRDYR